MKQSRIKDVSLLDRRHGELHQKATETRVGAVWTDVIQCFVLKEIQQIYMKARIHNFGAQLQVCVNVGRAFCFSPQNIPDVIQCFDKKEIQQIQARNQICWFGAPGLCER